MSPATANNFDAIYSSKGLLAAYNEADYQTAFLSNEPRNKSFNDHLAEQAQEVLFLRARDAAAELCADILHKEAEFVSAEADFDFEHPVNSFDIVVDGEKIGYLSVAHPVVLENIDKECAVAFFEIFTEKFASIKAGAVKYSEPSKFPAIDIDITFAAKIGDIVFSELLKAAKAAAGEILAGVTLKDTYEDGETSTVTLRFSFISKERTLTKQELAPATEAISAALAGLSMIVR